MFKVRILGFIFIIMTCISGCITTRMTDSNGNVINSDGEVCSDLPILSTGKRVTVCCEPGLVPFVTIEGETACLRARVLY